MVVCNEYCNTRQVLGTNVEHKAAQSGTKRIRGTHVRTSVGINVGADVSCTTSRSLCRRTVALSDRRITGWIIDKPLTDFWRTVVEPFVRLGQRGFRSKSFVWLGHRWFCWTESRDVYLNARGVALSVAMSCAHARVCTLKNPYLTFPSALPLPRTYTLSPKW